MFKSHILLVDVKCLTKYIQTWIHRQYNRAQIPIFMFKSHILPVNVLCLKAIFCRLMFDEIYADEWLEFNANTTGPRFAIPEVTIMLWVEQKFLPRTHLQRNIERSSKNLFHFLSSLFQVSVKKINPVFIVENNLVYGGEKFHFGNFNLDWNIRACQREH